MPNVSDIEIRLSKEQREALLNILVATHSKEVRERLVSLMGEDYREQAEKAADSVQPLFDLFLASL